MTDREKCEEIAEDDDFCNTDECWRCDDCPLYEGEFDCAKYLAEVDAAKAWIANDDKQKEPSSDGNNMKPFKVQVTPEQSKELQEALFAAGEAWCEGETHVTNTDKPFLLHKNYHRAGISYLQRYATFVEQPSELLHFHEALARVKAYKPAEVVVTCNGKRTTLSYKDAKTLNLV